MACVCGVHTVCGDQMKDGCARAAKWKMGPFLGQKRPMFAPPPSVWGNPWTHFSRSDLSLPNRQLLTGHFWLALCSCNCRWMQSFEVTVKCVHRCITDPHIADHNKDIKCKTCLMGTFIAALASRTCQDLGNFQIILDPLCLIVQEGIFNCAMWGLLNKLQLYVLSDWYYILSWIKTWFEAKGWRKFILFWRSQPWPWLHIPPCAVPSFLILANVCHILQGSRCATTNNGRNLLIPSMSCSLWAWKLNIHFSIDFTVSWKKLRFLVK